MITQNEYRILIQKIAPKYRNVNINWQDWYRQFVYYENMWDQYFKDFLAHRSLQRNEVSIVLWESCPGGLPFPHPNYAFDRNRFNNPIHGTFDKYLKTVCNTFELVWKTPELQNKIIGDVIQELNQKRVLIVDIYPTHGMTLNKQNRHILTSTTFTAYSLPKLNQVLTQLYPEVVSSNVMVSKELFNAGILNCLIGYNLPFHNCTII
jgi:hypothetical protein